MGYINDLIRKKYNTMTNRQQIVAKYILEHPKQVAFHTAKEVGEKSGTSETTVIRLCYSLELSGYSQLQKEVQASLLNEKQEIDPLVKFRTSTTKLSEEDNLPEYLMIQDMHYIEKTIRNISNQNYQPVIDMVISSEKTFVVGFRSSYAPANWLAFSLNIVRGNTRLYRGEIDDAIQTISEMDEKSSVIALSFPRYAEETAKFVKAAKDKGAKVIAITDNELSPVGLLADRIWRVETPSPTALKGMAPIFSVLNILVQGVASTQWEEVQKRVENYEKTSQQYYPFVRNKEDMTTGKKGAADEDR